MDEWKGTLDRLETEMEALKRQYDLFFQGGRRVEPLKERSAVETQLRRIGQRKIINTVDQFRFNTLQGRFYSLLNLWVRTIRDMEEGRLCRDADGRLGRTAPAAATLPAEPIDSEALERAAREWAAARTQCGQPTGEEELPALQEALRNRAREIAERAGNRQVEFRIAVEEGKPKIRAVLK